MMQVEKRNARKTVETKVLMIRLPISLSCGSHTNLAFKNPAAQTGTSGMAPKNDLLWALYSEKRYPPRLSTEYFFCSPITIR
jgi:hypothetical protein